VAVHGFRRGITGRITLRADEIERGILADVVGQLVEFVTPEDDPSTDPLARLVGIDPEVERPDDPALARLFPDAYPDDEEAADEFRRFTERSLRETKLANAAVVLDCLARADGESKVVLTDDEARAWLGTLNDLRLTLGSRLGIEEDSHEFFAALPEDHPAFAVFHVYDWLTFLQETLVQALTGLVSEPPPGAEL
jgi:hypothetical protein